MTECVLDHWSGLSAYTQEFMQRTLHHFQIIKEHLSLLFPCGPGPTCDALDSASLSAEPPQGLEHDTQMDRPLANTEMSVSHSFFSPVYNVAVNQYDVTSNTQDHRDGYRLSRTFKMGPGLFKQKLMHSFKH